MTRSATDVQMVQSLAARGANDSEISRRTGIPRSTIRDWRYGLIPESIGGVFGRSPGRPHDCARCAGGTPAPPQAAYAYLFGMYLGDGTISEHPRAFKLRIVLDAKYPGIISQCITAIEVLRPDRPVWHGRHGSDRCIEVSNYWQHWACLLPQHGPGRKHLRPIELEPWQAEIVAGHRHLFVRGLIHSDGCRIVANDRGRMTSRYHFSNLSEDIKALFCQSLDAMGVRWTRPCDRQIAVYRKESVAILDRFVGPKF